MLLSVFISENNRFAPHLITSEAFATSRKWRICMICLWLLFSFFALACSSLACTVQRVSQMVLFPHLAYYQSQCEELARSSPPTVEAVKKRALHRSTKAPWSLQWWNKGQERHLSQETLRDWHGAVAQGLFLCTPCHHPNVNNWVMLTAMKMP